MTINSRLKLDPFRRRWLRSNRELSRDLFVKRTLFFAQFTLLGRIESRCNTRSNTRTPARVLIEKASCRVVLTLVWDRFTDSPRTKHALISLTARRISLGIQNVNIVCRSLCFLAGEKKEEKKKGIRADSVYVRCMSARNFGFSARRQSVRRR